MKRGRNRSARTGRNEECTQICAMEVLNFDYIFGNMLIFKQVVLSVNVYTEGNMVRQESMNTDNIFQLNVT